MKKRHILGLTVLVILVLAILGLMHGRIPLPEDITPSSILKYLGLLVGVGVICALGEGLAETTYKKKYFLNPVMDYLWKGIALIIGLGLFIYALNFLHGL